MFEKLGEGTGASCDVHHKTSQFGQVIFGRWPQRGFCGWPNECGFGQPFRFELQRRLFRGGAGRLPHRTTLVLWVLAGRLVDRLHGWPHLASPQRFRGVGSKVPFWRPDRGPARRCDRRRNRYAGYGSHRLHCLQCQLSDHGTSRRPTPTKRTNQPLPCLPAIGVTMDNDRLRVR